ncbi:MAG: hypothetical protein GY861_15825 [bacterium]|nr:hypothetical protein [bacterium]
MDFTQHKEIFLSKKDKSIKGSVDEGVKGIIEALNSREEYFTTSSCAGRIVLVCHADRKKESEIIFAKHGTVSLKELKKVTCEDDVWLKQESFILHVTCRDIEAAQKLLDSADAAGFRKSGISTTKRKIIVEIIGAEHIEAIVSKAGKIVVSDELLQILIDEANKRMKDNKKKIKRFYSILVPDQSTQCSASGADSP